MISLLGKLYLTILVLSLLFVSPSLVLPKSAGAQSCPHPACGTSDKPCCYGNLRIDELTGCTPTFDSNNNRVCSPQYIGRILPCDGGSCETAPICNSSDSCGPPDAWGNCGNSMPTNCSSATCCGPGVVSSTSTPGPSPTGGGGPTSTNTPTPPGATSTGTPTPPGATNTPTPTTVVSKSCNVSIIPSSVTIPDDTDTSFSATVSGVTGRVRVSL